MKVPFAQLIAVAALCLLSGCATLNRPTTNNTTRARFLDEVWVSPSLRGKSPSDLYSKVFFSATGVAQLKKQGWWASQSLKTKEQIEVDARRLADRLHRSLIVSAHDLPSKKLQVVGQPGPDTLTVETAITEIVPAKAFWNAAATAAGFAVPGAGLLSVAGKGSIGIEGRLVDGNTGAMVAEFRHRMVDKSAVVNVASYRWYGGSEANLDEMARKTAEILNAPPDKLVTRPLPFKLVAF